MIVPLILMGETTLKILPYKYKTTLKGIMLLQTTISLDEYGTSYLYNTIMGEKNKEYYP